MGSIIIIIIFIIIIIIFIIIIFIIIIIIFIIIIIIIILQVSTTCSNVLKQPNGELQVAVNHNQLRTMASETVDPIDWSHPHPHGQYPWAPCA